VDAVKAQAIIQRSTTQLAAEKGTSVSWDDLLHTDIRGRLRVELLDQSLISLGPDSQVRVIRQAPSSEQSALELAYASSACGSPNSRGSASSCARPPRSRA
jgi:hypothetical protein